MEPHIHEYTNQLSPEGLIAERVADINLSVATICQVLEINIGNSSQVSAVVERAFTPAVVDSTPYERSATSGHQFDNPTSHPQLAVNPAVTDMSKMAQDAREHLKIIYRHQPDLRFGVSGEPEK